MGNCNTQTEEPMTDSCDFIIFIQNIITVDFVVAKNASWNFVEIGAHSRPD